MPTPLYMVYLHPDTGEAVVCGDEVGKNFAIKNYTRTMDAFKVHAQVGKLSSQVPLLIDVL